MRDDDDDEIIFKIQLGVESEREREKRKRNQVCSLCVVSQTNKNGGIIDAWKKRHCTKLRLL